VDFCRNRNHESILNCNQGWLLLEETTRRLWTFASGHCGFVDSSWKGICIHGRVIKVAI
jgi:hypothetical protein